MTIETIEYAVVVGGVTFVAQRRPGCNVITAHDEDSGIALVAARENYTEEEWDEDVRPLSEVGILLDLDSDTLSVPGWHGVWGETSWADDELDVFQRLSAMYGLGLAVADAARESEVVFRAVAAVRLKAEAGEWDDEEDDEE